MGHGARRLRLAARIGMVGALALTACAPADVPVSTSREPAPEADAALVVHDGAITVDGQPIAAPALAQSLKNLASERARQAASTGQPFRGRLSLQLQPSTPAGELLDILDAAGEAGFAKPWMLVRSPAGQSYGIGVTLPSASTRAALASEAAAPDRAARVQAGFANPVIRLDPERGIVVSARDEVLDPGGHGVVLGCPSTPCTAWRMGELNRLIRRLKLDHPRDRAVMLVPEATLPVQTVVDALDAARDDAVTARGTRSLLPQAILAREGSP